MLQLGVIKLLKYFRDRMSTFSMLNHFLVVYT